METRDQLNQADHLLADLEVEDYDLMKEIFAIRGEIQDYIHLCFIGQTEIAKLGLKQLSPRVDELVLKAGHDTIPDFTFSKKV